MVWAQAARESVLRLMLFFVHLGIAPEIQKIANMILRNQKRRRGRRRRRMVKTGLHQPALQTPSDGAIQDAPSEIIQNVATTHAAIRKRLKLVIGLLTSQVRGF